MVKRGSFTWDSTDHPALVPNDWSRRNVSTYILGKENASRALLSMGLPITFGSRKFQEGPLLASAGIISLCKTFYRSHQLPAKLAQTPFIFIVLTSANEVSCFQPRGWASTHRGRSGWRISYRCVLLSICVHHSPKTTQKTSENWKRLSYNKPLQAGLWTVVRSGWPSNAVRVAIFYARCHRQPSMRKLVYRAVLYLLRKTARLRCSSLAFASKMGVFSMF